MGFAGELTTIGLPEVFRNVSFNRLTGILVIRGQERAAAIHFTDGLARACNPGPGRVLDYAGIAEACGAAAPETIETAQARKRRRTLRSELASLAPEFDAAAYDAAVRAAVEEEIVQLFGLDNASFSFEEESPPHGMFDKEQSECGLAIDPESLVMEAARRHDEWHGIKERVGPETAVYLARDGDPPPTLGEAAASVLALLDGTRDLRAIAAELRFGRYKVLRIVAELTDLGLAARAGSQELRAFAEQARAHGDVNRAVDYLRRALEERPDDLELLTQLIALYEQAGRPHEAAREYRRMGEAREALGDIAGALTCYRSTCDLAPHDTDTLGRICALHDARGEAAEFRAAGLRLGRALGEQGQHEEALAIYQELLAREFGEQDFALHEAVAQTYVKLHEPGNAARELLYLAEWAEGRGEVDRAVSYYRNVLAVDRGCTQAAERLGELESRRLRARRRRHRRRLLITLCSVTLCLILWQLGRELLALEALQRAAHSTVAGWAHAPAAADPVDALAGYARICQDFPWTHGAAEAEAMAHTLLLVEVQRLREMVASDPGAAEGRLARLQQIILPRGVRHLWAEALADLERRIARAGAVSAASG